MQLLRPPSALRALIASIPVALSIAVTPAAALPRAWVGTAGVDTGSCSRAAPCRTFTYAITQVDSGGEVNVLDSGGYGEMAITKAVTVNVAPGITAGIIASSGAGMTINAGASDRVVLRGLTISANATRSGITANSFGALHVESCVLNGPGSAAGFPNGILITPAATAEVHVKDVIVRNFNIGVWSGRPRRCR
jgi:hypothetical protein